MSEDTTQTITITASQARDLLESLPDGFEMLATALDLAQAPVFQGQEKRTIVEIVIEGE